MDRVGWVLVRFNVSRIVGNPTYHVCAVVAVVLAKGRDAFITMAYTRLQEVSRVAYPLEN